MLWTKQRQKIIMQRNTDHQLNVNVNYYEIGLKGCSFKKKRYNICIWLACVVAGLVTRDPDRDLPGISTVCDAGYTWLLLSSNASNFLRLQSV